MGEGACRLAVLQWLTPPSGPIHTRIPLRKLSDDPRGLWTSGTLETRRHNGHEKLPSVSALVSSHRAMQPPQKLWPQSRSCGLRSPSDSKTSKQTGHAKKASPVGGPPAVRI